jgi:hypothetical protein
MQKLSWAVTAGDQIGDSEDDQPCGDHFIDNDLECHDGDAHRPTPGKNPYFQGDRKGPEDKSKTPERSGGEKNQQGHKRDRFERTKQNLSRYMTLLDNGHTPESLGREEVNHFADMWEDANGRPIDEQGIHDLSEMVNQKVAERGSYDAQKMGIHDPTAPKGEKGPQGRQLWKEDKAPFSRETEMPRDGGGMEHTPDSSGGGEDGGLYDLYKDILKGRSSGDGGDDGFDEWTPMDPSDEGVNHDWGEWDDQYEEDMQRDQDDAQAPHPEDEQEQEKWDAPDYQGTEDAGPEPKTKKGEVGPYEYQERQVDEWDPDASPEETKKYQQGERRRQTKKDYKRKRDAGKAKVPKAKSKKKAKSSLAAELVWARRSAKLRANPTDVAEGRPCGDGEDPKKGKCNPDIAAPPSAPAAPPSGGGKPPRKPPGQRPEGPAGPTDPQYRMSDKIKGPAKEGIGINPAQDPGREARMAQNLDFLTQDDGMDTNQTTNLMSNMMGGKPVQQPDGTSMVGSQAATPQEATQQNDDYRDTLTKSGWETHSEMGNKSVFKKGNTAVVLEKKNNGNQMKVKNLKPAAPRGRR